MGYTLGSTGAGDNKKEKPSTYEEVSQMIRDALMQGDFALGTAGKAPQSGLLDRVSASRMPLGSLSPNPQAATSDPVAATGDADRDWIIQRESSGNPNAKNPNSSAFGLGQLIKANREAYAKRFGFHPDTVNPQEQLQMMDAYVKERYGSYANARRFWEQNHWY